ncbi:hypothetical protein K469DRAFT_755239 [Zopfia rhizophila CBS 207.26]|uniref:DUF262 domain-containing protein n=1 Tax=Zopfia rhizophila CBS 207.26 TaxID=1314779 RepID=A0A6A6DHW3_9PEZI|nr:hypothetical protein K469DRAFT_755239 [Zopfia rhizophila CBS 207.26]
MDPNHSQPFVKDKDNEHNDFEGDELEGADDISVYKPRPQLPQPFVIMRPLSYLLKGLYGGFLDINPDYQRGIVWSGDRMTGLINSLMGGSVTKSPCVPKDQESSLRYNRERIYGKGVCRVSYSNLTQEREEDLFARVQLVVQLTQAEKMRVSTGPWQEFARLFDEDFTTLTSLFRDTSRAMAFQIILTYFS